MNPKEYVDGALRTKSELYHWDKVDPDLLHAVMGCETEVGEMMDALKRTIFYGKELDLVNIAEELGDVLWYIALAMHACGTDFETVMSANIEKLRKRYPEKFTSKNALERNLDVERKTLETHLAE